jgi:hypothetical protein
MTSVPPVPPTSSFIRPALALLAGLGIMVLIVAPPTLIVTLALLRGVADVHTFVPPAGFLVFTLALNALGGFASGYTVARLTAGRSFYTVVLLALILCISGAAEAFKAAAGDGIIWHPVGLSIVGPISVLLGGLFERRRTAAMVMER